MFMNNMVPNHISFMIQFYSIKIYLYDLLVCISTDFSIYIIIYLIKIFYLFVL